MDGEVRRVGLYLDASFRSVGEGNAAHLYRGTGAFGFMLFAAAVGAHFERFAVIARGTDDPVETPNVLPAGIELIPLPYYASLRQLDRVIAALPGTVAAMWRALGELDAVWVSGVHPFGLLLAVLAGLRRRRVVLLIRQDSPSYFRNRLPGRGWAPLLIPLRALDLAFRLLGRRLPTTVVGPSVGRLYRAPRPNVLEMRVNLLERAQLSTGPSAADWSGGVGLLTVGRLDPEKNPLLAARVLSRLDERFSLTWVGDGPLMGALRSEAERLGVAERLRLPGFIPFGSGLTERYRGAHCLLHISLTEGLPQVLYEAMGSGLPIVATGVGGVSEALEGGEAGLIVPPRDEGAVVAAIERLDADPALRRRLAERALALAARTTVDSESGRVAAFIRGDEA